MLILFQNIKDKSIIEKTSINENDYNALKKTYRKERFNRKIFLLILIIAIIFYVIFSNLKIDNPKIIIILISIAIVCYFFANSILGIS